MTYGVGMVLEGGLVLAADTRTNAGVDNIATFKKLHVWERKGERVLMLVTAGNLAVAQAAVALLGEEAQANRRKDARPNLFSAPNMFQAARVVGTALRDIRSVDGEALTASGDFSATLLLGGQIGKERPRLFLIYAEGNFIEATEDTPFLQVGETKYGKPILDRVAVQTMSLGQAGKLVLLSFDSTLRSNLSVGLPIDLMLYQRDSLTADGQRRIGKDHPYFRKLSSDWSKALRSAFAGIEELDN